MRPKMNPEMSKAHARLCPGVSRIAMAVLLVAPLAALHAGPPGFDGTGTVTHGNPLDVTFTPGINTMTIDIASSSPVTTINWTPSAAINGTSPGTPIPFLPAGQTVTYNGAGGNGTVYTVLNRIIPADTSRPIQFDGAITSNADTRVWFYSPGGLLIGSSATFNVSGLVLTTADPVTDVSGNFMLTPNQFSVSGAAGSTSAITIQPGAQITVNGSTGSNYMVAVAPQINQGGTINVAGSTALVAAESADFAIDSAGLFNISVTAGSTVSNNTFVHTGTTGSTDSVVDDAIRLRRVYMVAVPKNNAITMAISSGGSIGFDIAGAAAQQGNEIVLSAGSNIKDTGSGNPVSTGRAGSGAAALTIGAGSYTSNTYASSTDSLTVSDPVGNINFAADLTATAPANTVHAAAGAIQIAGDLTLDADSKPGAAVGTALVQADTGTTIDIGTNAVALGVNGSLFESANDQLGGNAGGAQLIANGGAITVAGQVQVTAVGGWSGVGANNPGGIATKGGNVLVSAVGGGKIAIISDLTLDASADGSLASSAYAQTGPVLPDIGINATGGIAQITASGTGSKVTASNNFVRATARGGNDAGVATGGSATAVQASAVASNGGLISGDANGQIYVDASAVAGAGSTGDGGLATAGSASIIANGATISTIGKNGFFAIASASGGAGGFSAASGLSGNGGGAIGGNALIETQGANGQILSNTSGSAGGVDATISVVANADGGTTSGGVGGVATGGIGTFAVTGVGQAIRFDGSSGVLISAASSGGTTSGGTGGAATGGNAQLLVDGGVFAVMNTGFSINAGAVGGNDSGSGTGGNAVGGTGTVRLTNGGSVSIDNGSSLAAAASGGSAGGLGGNAYGGNILVSDSPGGTYNFDVNLHGITVDTNATAGAGSLAGMSGSAGGALFQTAGSFDVTQGIVLTGNTSLSMRAVAGITVEPTAGISGTGDGAHLQLWADTGGSGSGTVTLGNGVINLSGAGATVDIDYNPTALGTPTDYSPGVTAGLLTAYQLVDNVNQLQQVGSFLDQNFALGRNIDASATAGWNGGAGFVPIGTVATPYSGNFDGLGNILTSLTINASGQDGVGLFGAVAAPLSGPITIRNLRLEDANILGASRVGGLIGSADGGSSGLVLSFNAIIGRVAGSSQVVGTSQVGGLYGQLLGSNVIVSNSHSDIAVRMIAGSASRTGFGGLVGDSGTASLTRDFATGAVTTLDGATSVGGLVGVNSGGVIDSAYATGAVNAGQTHGVGGLIGENAASVTRAYSTGAVTVGALSDSVGGLIGINNGNVVEVWTSSPISAGGSTIVGGIAGQNTGFVDLGYWDSYSTGQTSPFGSNSASVGSIGSVTSDPAQSVAGNYAFNPSAYAALGAADWIYPNQTTRPIGSWEIPVSYYGFTPVYSAHQLQLIDQNLAGTYIITQNIDMAGTALRGDIWGGTGLIPIGSSTAAFTGNVLGGGHVLVNLLVGNPTRDNYVGLFGINTGTIADLGLWNLSITQGGANTGGIAGENDSTIIDSFVTGAISGAIIDAGGIAGINTGTISVATANVALNSSSYQGGIAGANFGNVNEVFSNGTFTGSALAGGLVGNANATGFVSGYFDLSGTANCAASGGCGAVGLTTAQTTLASSFSGFPIDTTGGQGLRWRIYEGQTTPLLSAFLRPITVQPGSLSTQYNASTPSIGVFTYSAYPALLFGAAALSGLSANAGNHAITYAGGLFSNQIGYDLIASTTPGSLVITPATLTLSAVTDSRTYNATTGSAGLVQVLGLQGNDTVTGLSQSFDSANAGSRTLAVNAGYAVNDGNSGGNYSVTLQGAAGTITAAGLTVTYTANAAASIYGSAIPSLGGSATAAGLQGSDTLASVTSGVTNFNSAAGSNSPVGSYAINGSGITSASSNYIFTFTQSPGNATALTISPRPITITADALSRNFGVTNPALTYTISGPATGTNLPGLVNGDLLTGAQATSATITSPPGSYAITQGTLQASGNYRVTYVGNFILVTNISPPVVTFTGSVEGNIRHQTDDGDDGGNSPDRSEQEQQAEQAVEGGLKPPTITQSLIDDRQATQPNPVNTPVTSNGNPVQWTPGAQ